MPCNAFNHDRARCNCGFGGQFYGEVAPAKGSGYEWWPSLGTEISSYLNPNARCPKCGVSVYFYRSPHNGRVYFDDLGPPWPKHACTDSRAQSAEPLWKRKNLIPVLKVEPSSSYRAVDILASRSGARIWVFGSSQPISIEWPLVQQFNWDAPVFFREDPDDLSFVLLETIELRKALKGRPYTKRLYLRAHRLP